MNRYYIIFRLVQILFLVLLFVIPFVYCLIKGNFQKGFWFTWIDWSIVIFIFGITLPAFAELRERATGEHADIACGGFVFGILFGWLPGLLFASIGKFCHNVYVNIFSKQ